MANEEAATNDEHTEFIQVRKKVLALRAENLALSRDLIALKKVFNELKERLRQSRG